MARQAIGESMMTAPDFVDVECLSVLRRLAREGRIDATRADTAVEDLIAAPIHREPTRALVPDAWSHRHTISPYDAVYVALSKRLNCPLLTMDARLMRAAHGLVQVIVP